MKWNEMKWMNEWTKLGWDGLIIKVIKSKDCNSALVETSLSNIKTPFKSMAQECQTSVKQYAIILLKKNYISSSISLST